MGEPLSQSVTITESVSQSLITKCSLVSITECHIRYLSFTEGKKIFTTCTKCQDYQASAENILIFKVFYKGDLYSIPCLCSTFLLDLVSHRQTPVEKQQQQQGKTNCIIIYIISEEWILISSVNKRFNVQEIKIRRIFISSPVCVRLS